MPCWCKRVASLVPVGLSKWYQRVLLISPESNFVYFINSFIIATRTRAPHHLVVFKFKEYSKITKVKDKHIIKLFSHNIYLQIYKQHDITFTNIYQYTSHVYSANTRRLTTSKRTLYSIDVTVVVELAFRIQDLPHNKPCELLAHCVNLIDIVNYGWQGPWCVFVRDILALWSSCLLHSFHYSGGMKGNGPKIYYT